MISLVASLAVGLPHRFDAREASTLGMQLVTTRAEQLDARLEYSGDDGTRFTLTFHRQE